MADPIVIVSAARTPIGGLLGDFAALPAHQLGAVAIKAAVERAGMPGDAVDEVLMGNCLMAGQGQAPARQAVLGAGLPQSAGAVTLSKMCGSGMRAMMFAHDMLLAEQRRRRRRRRHGEHDQRAAPRRSRARACKYGAAAAVRPHGDRRPGRRLREAAERRGKAMGVFAEECVAKYGFTREAMDQFAIASTERAKRANEDGSFDWEMAPVDASPARPATRVDQARRAAVQGQARQDPRPQAGVQERRHDHRGDLVEHLRRRRRAGADARVDRDASSAASRSRASSRHAVHAQAPNLVHDRAGRRDREGAEEGRLGRRATSTCGRSTRRSPRSRWRR